MLCRPDGQDEVLRVAKEKCFQKFTVALAELVAEGLHVDAALVGELHRDVLDDDASSLRRSRDLKKTGFRRDLGVGTGPNAALTWQQSRRLAQRGREDRPRWRYHLRVIQRTNAVLTLFSLNSGTRTAREQDKTESDPHSVRASPYFALERASPRGVDRGTCMCVAHPA